MGRTRRITLAATLAAALATVAPAVAGATTVTITGDDGQPALLNASAPPTLRNMEVKLALTVPNNEAANYTVQAYDPAGTPVGYSGGGYCWSLDTNSDSVPYHGNGAYRFVVTRYTGVSRGTCTGQVGSPITYTWNVAASVAVAAPAGPVLIRQRNSYSTATLALPFSGNPGSPSYEIRYAKGGVIGADGGISGPSQTAYVDSASGAVQFSPSDPGSYVVVARATADGYSTPWSAPAIVRAQAPFDLRSTSFPDSIGPRYRLRATLGEDSPNGRVTVSIAKGSKKGKYHRLGRAKISSKGTISLKFTVHGRGTYRLRYSFKGSSTTRKGSVVEKIHITRRLI